jgi:aspartate 1-decarboxylase
MNLTLLKGKLHRATVTGSHLGYEGSITIDPALMRAAGLLPYEQVDVLNINNGARFTTYTIEGAEDSGEIIINGAAARLVQVGDIVIICAFAAMTPEEAAAWKPKVVLLDAKNKVPGVGC